MQRFCRAIQDTDDNMAQCALHAGYLRLQIRTLRLCNTYCFSPSTMVFYERASMLRYTYISCLVCLSLETLLILNACDVVENLSRPVLLKPLILHQYNFQNLEMYYADLIFPALCGEAYHLSLLLRERNRTFSLSEIG